MPMSIQVVGLDEMLKKVEETGKHAEGIAAKALYVGAGIVADSITQAAKNIRTAEFKYAAGGRKRLPSPEEKAALLSAGAAGIAKFEKNGLEVNTSVGYGRSGYVQTSFGHMRSTARTNYKIGDDGKATQSSKARLAGSGGASGKPVAVIANAINSGTSFMVKQPFIRDGIKRAEGKAKAAIEAEIVRMVDEALKDL